MKPYVILIRGINVGGKNRVPMAELRKCLEALGFGDVRTYIASGNVILTSDKNPAHIKSQIEQMLPKQFKLDSQLIKVLVLTKRELLSVISQKPKGFGEEPATYHSDVIFLMDITAAQAIKVFKPREGVDTIWKGKGVIYSQRLSAFRTKSRLNQIMGTPEYKCMTVRNWNTTTMLGELLQMN